MIAVIVLGLGPIGLLLTLLNARDRRRDRALAAALGACPREWRGALALHVRAPLLSRRVVLRLDVSDGDPWAVVRRMADAVPARVTFVVDTPAGGRVLMTAACASSGTR